MKIPVILLCIVLILSITSGCEKTTQVYIDTVATPVFSPEPYMYNLPMEVSIYCATPGVEIRYTTEGYYTAENSHRYTGPITINATTTIKAVAFKKGMNHSELATGNFLANTGWGMWCDIVNIQADPDTIFASGENSTSVISVKVLDGLQFSIANQPVQFHANYGNIPENALTDSSGVARATYTPPLGLAGVARITATVERYNPDYPDLLCSADTAYIEVTIQPSPPGSQEVHALQFYQSGQIDLNVINTGGVEDYSARVKLYDGNSNLFIEPRSVWFKIMNANPLTGVNLNGHSPSDSVLVISSNGIAQVTLNSGIQSGSLTIRASCTDAGHYVTALKSNIVIHPGPPHRLEPFMGGFSTGEILGGGLWRIVVGAHVFDIYSNPVDYGTSIWFYIPDNQFNCQIGSNAYVGNESAYGDSTAGTAYTWLIYSGIYSLETITISVATGGEAFGGASIVLPLNQPQLELEISPGNLPVFHGNVNPVPESIAVTLNVSLFDVQGCPIHHARFLLTTTYGYFEFTEDSDPEIPNIISSDNGFPHGMIRFFASGIPLGNPETGSPGELSVTLGLNLIGYDVSSSGTITLTRYPT